MPHAYAPLRLEERTFWSRAAAKFRARLRPRAAANRTAAPPLAAGLVGAGNVARWLYLPRLQRPGAPFRLAAVFDPDPAACRHAAAQTGADPCDSLSELIDRDDLAAVFVCSPVAHHAAAVEAALAARKHVLCEKPLGATYAEADALCKTARRSARVHMVNFSYRFRPDLAFAARIVRAGALGRVYHLSGSITQGLWFTAAGRPASERVDAAAWKFARGGGVVLDLGPHLIDFARCCLGEIASVQASTRALRADDQPCDDLCAVTLGFANGATAQLLTSRWATGHKERTLLEFSGSEGGLILDQGNLKIWTRSQPRWRPLLIPPLAHGDFLACFRDAIEGRADDLPNFEDGLRNNEAIEAIFLSARAGRTMPLPLQTVPAHV